MKLLGRIERRSTFYNFFPQYELIDGKLKELSSTELKTKFPPVGGINLSHDKNRRILDFFEEEVIDYDNDYYARKIYLIDIEESQLEENNNPNYRKKLDLIKITKPMEQVFQRPDDILDIYKIIPCEPDTFLLTDLSEPTVLIDDEKVIEGDLIVFDYNDRYYGPFTVNYRKLDDRYYIQPDAERNDFLIPFYPADAAEIIKIEKQTYLGAGIGYGEPKYTEYIFVTGRPQMEDVISDEILLQKVTDEIPLELAKTDPATFIDYCYTSPYLVEQEERFDRVKELLGTVNRFTEEKHRIFEMLSQLYQDGVLPVSEKMVKDSEAYKNLHLDYRKKKDEYETLQHEHTELQAQLDRKNAMPDVTAEQLAQYQATIAELQAELDTLKAAYPSPEIIAHLQKEKEELEQQHDTLKAEIQKYEERITTAQQEVSHAIEAGVSSSASVAFDPYIANSMLKAAAEWDAKTEHDGYLRKQEMLSEVPVSALQDTALIEYIVSYVQARREYSRNDILNIYISIAQNFITIFSGEPGTGKTSICNIISETLGLTGSDNTISRFVSVSVERGWSSKRDLIGYFNPLTRKYDKSNGKIYDALQILDKENENSQYPFFILLDEANLSPIEYYWADFMRLTDRTSTNDMYINIGMEKELFVPETLRFVATINTDQTTEALSPRLIDRACIIRLPDANPKQGISSDSADKELIPWHNFTEAFSKDSELLPTTQEALKAIYALFHTYGMHVSPRTQFGMEKYIKAAQCIMEDESDVLAKEKAIDYAVMQKLLPKINGYYANYEQFFVSLKQICETYHLKMTNEAIDKMIDDQERNMGYCQYLI